MKLRALTMQLLPGYAEEYRKRHDEIWPELEKLILAHGISDYSIHLDERSNLLFAVCKVKSEEMLKELPDHPLMKKWWKYMADIMETNEDYSPKEFPLSTVFVLNESNTDE